MKLLPLDIDKSVYDEPIIFKAATYDNFMLWKKHEEMHSTATTLRLFIDNKILDTNQALFIMLYEKFSELCQNFYNSLKECCANYGHALKEGQEIVNSKLSFDSRIYEVYIKEAEFDIKKFTINTLNVTPDFMLLIARIVY
jgi:hypothetical protein